MKKILNMIVIISFIGLALYALYLLYDRFIKKSVDDEFDDLEDWGYEFEDVEKPEVAFSDRIRAAAERQLGKVRA